MSMILKAFDSTYVTLAIGKFDFHRPWFRVLRLHLKTPNQQHWTFEIFVGKLCTISFLAMKSRVNLIVNFQIHNYMYLQVSKSPSFRTGFFCISESGRNPPSHSTYYIQLFRATSLGIQVASDSTNLLLKSFVLITFQGNVTEVKFSVHTYSME